MKIITKEILLKEFEAKDPNNPLIDVKYSLLNPSDNYKSYIIITDLIKYNKIEKGDQFILFLIGTINQNISGYEDEKYMSDISNLIIESCCVYSLNNPKSFFVFNLIIDMFFHKPFLFDTVYKSNLVKLEEFFKLLVISYDSKEKEVLYVAVHLSISVLTYFDESTDRFNDIKNLYLHNFDFRIREEYDETFID